MSAAAALDDFKYQCRDKVNGPDCALTCTSLEACQACQCAIVPLEASGPWGDFMDVLLSILPILFLIYVTIKKNPWPTSTSLPTAALIMFLVRIMYLESDPLLCAASVILGWHETITPLSIIAGAMILFETMEATYCLPYMMREIKDLTSGHPVAELMLIFAFAYMVEGASGFGTPVALGAPMLVSQGHAKLESVVTLLVFNTFATVFGAVGTPIWFGFGGLGLSESEFSDIGFKAGLALAVGAFSLVPYIQTILVPWRIVRANLLFTFASLSTVLGPVVALSVFNYEFPSLLGGLLGCMGTALLCKFKVFLSTLDEEDKKQLGRDGMEIGSVSDNSIVRKFHKSTSAVSEVTTEGNRQVGSIHSAKQFGSIHNAAAAVDEERSATQDMEDGLEAQKTVEDGPSIVLKESNAGSVAVLVDHTPPETEASMPHSEIDTHLGPRKTWSEGFLKETLQRTFPIWGSVVLLILTRVEEIGIKEILTDKEPNFSIALGNYGTFKLSASLVFQLYHIFSYPNLNWKFELFYLPFMMPFVLVSAATIVWYRKDMAASPLDIIRTVVNRLKNPAVALLGALVLVQLMIRVDTSSPSHILGTILSDWFKEAFIVLSPLLGALGSFFSGSTTVSNLTFGSIQQIAAESIGTSKTSMLALQAVGGSAGNGICLNNIIAACAVVGVTTPEGQILARTAKYVFAFTTIATIVMLALFFRF